jgi:nitrite reductase/ring-hydroxylating ferredoxin subunit
MLAVSFGGRDLAIYDIGGTVYATDNLCTHAYAQLTDGTLEGGVIECPLHGGRFEVKTGRGLGPPIPCDLKTYPARIVDNEIQVLLPDVF